MYAVVDPGNHRHVVLHGLFARRFGERDVLRLDVVETRMILLRRCHDEQNRAALVCVANDLDRHAVAQISDGRNVFNELVMPHGLEAKLVAENAFWCRDSGIVGNVRREHVDIGVASIDIGECGADG